MQGKVVFARGSSNRKPKFQLITLIRKSGQDLSVFKRAAYPEATEHLMSFAAKRSLLVSAGINCNVAKTNTVSDTEISFDFVQGTSLESQFNDAMLRQDLNKIKKIFDRVFEVIDSLPTQKVNPSEDKRFSKVFGNYYNKTVECISPACIDFNLDNLIENNGKLTLIDYEWVFNFVVPKSFIKLRVLHITFLEMITPFLKAQPDLRVTSFLDDFFVPSEIYEKYKGLFVDINAYLLSNIHFSNYLFIPQSKFLIAIQKQELTASELLKSIMPYSTSGYLEQIRLRDELISSQTSIISTKEKIIETKQTRIDELEKTLTYKFIQRAEIRSRQLLKKKP